MPAQRPRASFEPIAPEFNLKALVESTPNFSYVDRISCDMIDTQGMAAFEKLVLLHVIVGGKPLVIDGFEDRLDPWTFNPKWLRDNCGDKVENARNLTAKENLPLTMGHYLKNMGLLTNQFFEKPGAYREKGRQRVYLKDIDCPEVWWNKLKEHLPAFLTYLNDSTGDVGGPGAVPDSHNPQPGKRLGKGIARAGDLMSSLPPDMRAENLMCYIGHEGTYTPSHREMCASLGQNIMVEASTTVSEDGKAEKPGSSIWFMTESKDRHLVSEYWLSVLGHDIEVENHFAQVVAWKKAPFSVYVVEQRPGDFILIPPLAPHQVWNRGTRTMKVAWNRTTVETLEMAIHEALPRSRVVCREEQYKNKAIIYYTLQKYASLLSQAMAQAARMPRPDSEAFLYRGKIKQLFKDFKRLFDLYKQVLLSEMFSPEERDAPKSLEYVPFDSNVTCAYCRCNIFNRFLTCTHCKDVLGHQADEDGDPYDICMDCYAMGRSCRCQSNYKWVEQFRWKELASKYDTWRKLIIQLEGGVTEKTPLAIIDERRRYGKKTLAEVCKDQLKRRPFVDINKSTDEPKDDDESDEEIVVGDDGQVKKIQQKKSKSWLKNNVPCHVCCHRHPSWKMAKCTTCDRSYCYGSLFRGWDKMPMEIMEDQDWTCPHCLGICFAGACKREGKMVPYEPKGTLLGHDTKKVADVRSIEALVDFSVSNLNWLKDDDPSQGTKSRRMQKARAEAEKNKSMDPSMGIDDDEDEHLEETQVEMEYSPTGDHANLDPALGGSGVEPGSRRRQKQPVLGGDVDEDDLARRLQEANSVLPPPDAMMADAPAKGMPDGYAPLTQAEYSGYGAPPADMYGDPDAGASYQYPGYRRDADGSQEPGTESALRPFKKRRRSGRDGDEDAEHDEIAMTKGRKNSKKPRLAAAGFRSYDLAEQPESAQASRAKNEAQQQFEREKERKALEKAKKEGRFIMLQAAMKNKKRVVKLPLPGHRLGQLMAQQAAKAALTAGEDQDADHEVEAGAAQQNGEEEDVDNDASLLLKSDVAPKRTFKNLHLEREQKIKEGKILSGGTKKALIPIDKDDDYDYRYRERVNGKRVDKITDLPATAASKKEKRKSHTNRRPIEYEEVDVASDEDDAYQQVNPSSWNAVNSTSKSNRRSLPGYLQERHQEDGDVPDELPEDYRDKHHNPNRGRSGFAKESVRSSAASAQLQAETEAAASPASARKGQVAGKAPSMRPQPHDSSKDPIEIEDNSTDSDDEVNDVIDSAFGTVPVNGTSVANGNMSPPTSSSRAVGRPSKQKVPASSARQTAVQVAALQAQKTMEENRLAKLQALQVLDDSMGGGDMYAGTGRAGGSHFADAGGDLFGDDESDDGIDEVPARVAKV